MIANNKSVTKNRDDGTSHVIGQKGNVMNHGHLELVQIQDWVRTSEFIINHNFNHNGK